MSKRNQEVPLHIPDHITVLAEELAKRSKTQKMKLMDAAADMVNFPSAGSDPADKFNQPAGRVLNLLNESNPASVSSNQLRVIAIKHLKDTGIGLLLSRRDATSLIGKYGKMSLYFSVMVKHAIGTISDCLKTSRGGRRRRGILVEENFQVSKRAKTKIRLVVDVNFWVEVKLHWQCKEATYCTPTFFTEAETIVLLSHSFYASASLITALGWSLPLVTWFSAEVSNQSGRTLYLLPE
ncbi:hypothetical protein Tco_1145800 [Tanacetum coccineum]